jgi:hypothetical protein
MEGSVIKHGVLHVSEGPHLFVAAVSCCLRLAHWLRPVTRLVIPVKPVT